MIANYDPIVQALLASLFTWGITALGAALVFVLPSNSKKFLDISLGFAGGVMTAASFWSLLAPAIEISEANMGSFAFIPVAIGFSLGALFVHLSDNLIPSCVVAEISIINVLAKECLETNAPKKVSRELVNNMDKDVSVSNKSSKRYNSENNDDFLRRRIRSRNLLEVKEVINCIELTEDVSAEPSSIENDDLSNSNQSVILSWKRILLLIMAVTVHNIPEGLAVGVGFGSIGKTPAATFEKAFNLALGIGLQNFPEGLAVSLPLAGFGYSKTKSFFYGQLSGMVEPFAALLGAAAVLLIEPVLPYALSFAAGAMIYVVFDDIVPEAQRNNNGKLASAGAIIGFLVMMCLDVGLG